MTKQQQLFFTETDRGHPLSANACLLDQCRLGTLRTALTPERGYILGTPRIIIPFDPDLDPLDSFQKIGIGLDALNLLTRNFGTVEFEIYRDHRSGCSPSMMPESAVSSGSLTPAPSVPLPCWADSEPFLLQPVRLKPKTSTTNVAM